MAHHVLDSASSELFERLPSAATIVDERGRVLKANAEARRLAGDPIPGQTCRQYWKCSLYAGRCPLRKAMRPGGLVRRAKVAQGHGCAIERVAPFTDVDGRRKAVILTGPATAYYKRIGALRRAARVDGLSRVLNRRSFDVLTARAVRRERRRQPAAFLMMDIDGLKSINDRFGHAAGDGVIARLGQILSRCARREDVVGRVGGDEFAVYCARTTRAQACGLVKRIQDAIREDNARHPGDSCLSVQIGLACASGAQQQALRETADRGLRRLKLALHRTKRVGSAVMRRGYNESRLSEVP